MDQTAPEHPGLLPAVLLGESVDGRAARRSGRDWFVDILCFVLSVAGGAALFAVQPGMSITHEVVLLADVLGGVGGSIALWWRRRWPVEIAVVLSVVSIWSASVGIAATIALFTVAVHRPGRVLVPISVLSIACACVFIVVRPDKNSPLWVNLALVLAITAATVAWGMFARARRQLVLSLRERAERAEAEQQLRVAQARQLERTRIAREMHDVLAHRISLVSLHAGALEYRAETVGGDVARSAAIIRESAHQALDDLREVIGVLREGPGDDPVERPQPTVDDVTRLIEESQDAGVKVSARLALDPAAALPPSIGRTAYRVVQEGLTNARKHAPGSAVSVTLEGGPGSGLEVEVLTRGSIAMSSIPGAIPGAGQGLVGLTERADLAGGRLEHGRTADGDFRLHAWLPWPA